MTKKSTPKPNKKTNFKPTRKLTPKPAQRKFPNKINTGLPPDSIEHNESGASGHDPDQL